MAFEGYSLYPPLSVRENIAFALKAQQLRRSETARRVDAIARLVDIEDILDSYPRNLSGGQQQRVSLARALVRDADLYLLDEPMGQLEPQLRAILRGRIKGLLAERGMTAIFVTHDQTEASALADRVAVMENGVLQQFASERELKERPVNLFVASFIGEPPMNLLDANVELADGNARLSVAADTVFEIPADTFDPAVRRMLQPTLIARIGIRPQKVSVGTGNLRARVISNQWLGDQSHIALDFVGNRVIAVTSNRIAARMGEIVPFGIEPSHLHIFSDDGKSLRHAMSA
jgi:multiple sugar transport system ATP-binding protein